MPAGDAGATAPLTSAPGQPESPADQPGAAETGHGVLAETDATAPRTGPPGQSAGAASEAGILGSPPAQPAGLAAEAAAVTVGEATAVPAARRRRRLDGEVVPLPVPSRTRAFAALKLAVFTAVLGVAGAGIVVGLALAFGPLVFGS